MATTEEDGDVCGIEWECELKCAGTKTTPSWECDRSPQNKASGSVSQLWWTWAQLKVFYPAGARILVKLRASRRTEAGIGFRGAGGERIRKHGQMFA